MLGDVTKRFRDVPPPGFPPALVPTWGTVLDAANRTAEVYAAAGAPAENRDEARELHSRAFRLLNSVPKTAEERANFAELADRLVADLEVFELEHAGAATRRAEELERARSRYEETKPKSTLEKAGATVDKALNTAQLVAIAVVVWVVAKQLKGPQ